MAQPEHFHIIHVKYLSLTHNKPGRIKITSHRFNESITVNYDDYRKFIDEIGIAKEVLTRKGFEVIGWGQAKKGYNIVTRTFKSLKNK